MISKIIKCGLLVSLCVSLIFVGCEYDGPEQIFDPDEDLGVSPTISAVIPSDSAVGGVNRIRIVGENFSADPTKNSVYLGGEKLTLLSSSPTELVFRRPASIVGNDLALKVVVDGAFQIPGVPYAIKEVLFVHGDFSGSFDIYTIAVDRDDNLYAASAQRNIWKVTPDGVMTEYVERTGFRSSDDLKVGPDGYLYVALGDENLERVPPGGGEFEEWGTSGEDIAYFDWDANGNIYGGDRRGVWVMSPDGSSSKEVGNYADFSLIDLRVYDGYVYFAAEYRGGDNIPEFAIWRNQILDDTGTLGDNELFYDWANSGDYAMSEMTAMIVAQDGTWYIGTDRETDPVFVLNADGSTDILYAGMLAGYVDDFVWGAGNFAYLNRGDSASERRVVRIDLGQPGAPYFGRN